ncbi:nucleolar protein 8 isoform X2 [Microtus ochrogaster]|uniref:Nucleolar protein 8 isoform X2 n=1 Tax=Microtus ochrogaster TaxID=79684 RepID=A0ABM1UA71_MICOH|nr:nucleolar protein 8 isoform X2 [Microtus ochrogaster]
MDECPVFMKANREMKRLFVGGLGQGISETDLQNQFSRFGEVSNVEIITRKDDQGNSQKVFAYVNIKITEADLKKCMSVLNKTKWKGGTLQIQLAKESFLHRLAQEREEAKAKKENPTSVNTNLVEKMGGVDFHMKAVPGTEVPGHKNWVVSKFGRVLPVLHLKNQHKHKIMKYDPSKYCHNLKKISEDLTETIPITDLTWELEGGNDPMSKKRRGEFSDFHFPPQKIKKVQKGPMESKVSNISLRTNEVMESNKSTQPTTVHRKAPSTAVPSKSLHVPSSGTQKPKHMVFHTSDFEIIWNKSRMSDDDIDSEEELKVMIAKEENLQKTRHSLVNESENDPFEVVRDDFKSDTHRLRSSTSSGNDSDCDSSDTDKIIAMKKNTVKVKNSAESSQPEKSISMRSSFKKIKPSNDCVEVQNTKSNKESALGHEGKFLNPKFPPDSNTSDSEESEEDEEYKALMKNCPRVNLTLADLECLAGSHQKVPGNDESDGSQNSSHCKFNTTSKSPKTSNDLHSGRQCICPEEIVASLLEEENTYSRQKTEETTLKPKFQAFKGIGGLYAKESGDKTLKETVDFNNINEQSRSSLKHEEPDRVFIENGSKCTNGSSNKLTSCQPAKKVNNPNHIQSPKRQSTSESQSHKVVSFTCFDKESQNPLSCPLPLKGKKSLSAKSHKIESDRDTCHQPKSRKASEKEDTDSSNITSLEKPPKVSFREDPQKSTASFSLSVSDASCMSAKDKHAEDNQKRLAALAVWQKAREVQKKLVHNALANLDAHPENKKTHIVFASDNESETEETSTQEQNSPGKELVTESVGKASGKLFDSSDDEDSDSKEDSTRFNIKPQFEGRAGQKLMDLQSHFGNDERFRMDSRFLESDSEEEQQKELNEIQTNEDELAAERKQTLNVVQSVLNINLSNPTSKGAVAVKKFKDIVHYDPTKHDHAIYERKQEDNEKESKVKRKKKREEAEKLPEVSQDMYHNITTDLKEIFQHTKNTDEKEEDTPWNEDCGREETEEVSVAATLTSGAEHTSGFTFSFFDSDTKDIKEDTYRTEPVKRGKIVYQEDPRFQDSSSEEEEEEVTKEADHKRPSPGEAFPVECTRFFFFSENDDRLHGRSILPFSGVEQVVVQLLLIVYSTQLHLQVLTHCSLMCFIPLHYKAFRGQ